jgi:hypothetical protein
MNLLPQIITKEWFGQSFCFMMEEIGLQPQMDGNNGAGMENNR